MSIQELQDFMRIPRTVAYSLVKASTFPAQKIDGRWQISEQDLKKWIRRKIDEKGAHYGKQEN